MTARSFARMLLLAGALSAPLAALAQTYSNLTTGVLNVTTSATLIVASSGLPRTVTVLNNTGTDMLCIGGSGVTAGGAGCLPAIQGASITLTTSAAIYGVVPTTTQSVGWWSTF